MIIDRVRIREMLVKELRQMFRDPRMKRVVFVAPILQLLAFGYAVNTDIRNTRTFIIDRDRTSVSRELVDAFTSTGYFSVVGRSDDSSDLVRALDRRLALLQTSDPADKKRIEGRVAWETDNGLTLTRPFYELLAQFESSGQPFARYLPTLLEQLPEYGR